ncbi:hypothetical protein CCYN2B_50142 [Capnocytophaga cynodegmi]|uniref:Uncharacterized protein n=1 Tax=Capnocytophaga cynodegmi TaxID=28189 RepID=A0A0B7HHN6_9FLAO|nr:hypothetical protein CCYN2B_50142 [Capnocytophaga cynodegmi]
MYNLIFCKKKYKINYNKILTILNSQLTDLQLNNLNSLKNKQKRQLNTKYCLSIFYI